MSAGAAFDVTTNRAAPLARGTVAQLLAAALQHTDTLEYIASEDRLRVVTEPNLTLSGNLGVAPTAATQQLMDLRQVMDELMYMSKVSLRREARALLPKLNEEQVAGLCVHMLRHRKRPARWP